MKKINCDSKIKAVVFDLDHTLFDRYETLRLVAGDLFRERSEWFAKGLSAEELSEVIVEADSKYIISGWKRVYEYWLEKSILSLDKDGNPVADQKEVFDFIWNYGFFKYAVKYPFSNPMLDELRAAGYKVGLLTNASNEEGIKRQRAKLRMLEMTEKFDEIIISGEVNLSKPDKRVFDIMAERIGLAPENMLYVGDNPINDVEGSRNAGYIPVWVRIREKDGEVCECEYSVCDVSEIPVLVDKING